jgi:hypothetical protein
MRFFGHVTIVSLLAIGRAQAGAPEPWSDQDPPEPPKRYALGDFGFRPSAEYRVQLTDVRPVAITEENHANADWIEQRLRLDLTADWKDKVRIVASVDVLDGVLWGDNGDLGKDPEPTSGANVNTTNPNFSRLCMTLRDASTPLDPHSYGLGLCPTDVIFPRRLYGEVMTPVGMLRIGRQPFTEGASVALNDGDGRKNRFGIANRGNSVDRILFATKPFEALKPASQRDASPDRGFFLVFAYDRLVTDQPQRLDQALHGWVTAVRLLAPKHPLGTDLETRLYHAFRWDEQYGTAIHAIGGRLISRFGRFWAGLDGAMIAGSTREVSDAFRVITNDPSTTQAIRQMGARAVIRYDLPWLTAYLEADYASGDADPQVRTPLTQFRFAEDTNVGLLLFKHVLAYQTGQAAAAAIPLLQNLKAPSLPVEAVASRGSFTNAAAIFPQVDVRPMKNLLLRGGALFAWAAQPVNDPINSQQRRDGLTINDDLVNFAGGKPGSFYGVELDARVQYRMFEHVAFDLEGAMLFPGDALRDKNGYAARSGMVQGRTTLWF